MFKKAALDFVGEPAIGTETSAEEAGDVALGGTLARALDGIDNAAQKAALRRSGLAGRTLRQLAGHNPDKTECYSWLGPFSIIEIFSCVWLPVVSLVVVIMGHKGYVLIR